MANAASAEEQAAQQVEAPEKDSPLLDPKLPRMRWKTYRKLKVRYAALQRRRKAGAAARFGMKF